MESKNRPKIAASVVHPKDNAALFDEGWEQALSRETSLSAGKFSFTHLLYHQTEGDAYTAKSPTQSTSTEGDGVLVDAA